MRHRSVLTILALLLLTTPLAFAGEFISLDSGLGAAPAGDLVQVEVTQLPNGGTRLEYTVHGFETAPVTIRGEAYRLVSLAKEGRFLDAGAPDLPNVARSIIIPDDAEMQARLVSSSYRDFPGFDVAPSKGNLTRNIDPATVPYVFGPSYGAGAWTPAEPVVQRDPYILRDYRGMVVEFRPFRYSAASHTMRVYDHAVIEVVPVGPGRVNVLDRAARPQRESREFQPLYSDHFVNFALEGDRYPAISEVGEMLVIAYDDFLPNLQPFVDWKNQMGIPTTLVAKSEVGTSATQFQTYITNYYNAHDLAFVLLVGDLPQIPSPTNGGAPADPAYSLVSGSDSYPDIFIGRLSAETAAQVDLQVQKFVQYERDPQPAGDWYHQGIGIGSAQGDGIGDDGEADWVHIDGIRADLLGFTYTLVDRIYDPGATASMVATAVNNGRSIINYCGHGSTNAWSTTGFSSSHVAQLTNHNMLPFIISVACVNGAFQDNCFAEAWLRASQGGEPTGAVGMYASTVNMSWAPPMAAQDETTDLLTLERRRTFGALCFSGSCQMIDEYNAVGEFKNWHVFGDPSLRVRTDSPTELSALHDTVIDEAATSFTVTVPGTPGALCGLIDGGTFLGSAFADANGLAEIQFVTPIAGQTLTLTVTDFNRVPYIAQIPVYWGPVPELTVTPDTLQAAMIVNQTLSDTLYVSNSGAEGSRMRFTITVNGMGGGSPWIIVAPERGNLLGGETEPVEVIFDTHGVDVGSYEAQIIVSAPNVASVTVTALLEVSADPSAVDGRGKTATLTLMPAQPNPCAGATALAFSLPQAESVRLAIYDMNGRLVRNLLTGPADAGAHLSIWDGRDDQGRRAADGVYFSRLDAAGQSLSQKVMVLN
jgi:hypothetical protein